MKIWFPLIAAGTGSDVYTVRLAKSLKSYGVDTEITFFPKYFEFAPSLLRKYQLPIGTNIVHTNSWGAFAFRRSGIPLVVTVHHNVMDPAYHPYKTMGQHIYHKLLIEGYEAKSLKSANLIVSVSNYTDNSICHYTPEVERVTIYNFVDPEFFYPAHKNAYSRARPFRMLYVGNLSRRKGADLLLPIMEKLGKNFRLTTTTRLRDSLAKLDNYNIHTCGKLSSLDLVKAYQIADALLFPSRFEGFGYVALEAMACGTPVIASNNSSIPEVVQHGKTGILCQTDDIDAFVEACRILRNDPLKLAAYGAAARKRAVSFFSERKILRQYIDLYNSLLSK